MSLGSGLSNTVNSVHIAINMLKEDFPNCNIKVIDSKIASLGLTVMLNKLVELRDNDVEADEAFEIVNSKVINTIAYYTTDTLTYFARGGRFNQACNLQIPSHLTMVRTLPLAKANVRQKYAPLHH